MFRNDFKPSYQPQPRMNPNAEISCLQRIGLAVFTGQLKCIKCTDT